MTHGTFVLHLLLIKHSRSHKNVNQAGVFSLQKPAIFEGTFEINKIHHCIQVAGYYVEH